MASIIAKATCRQTQPQHNALSSKEMKDGCRLGIDSWADTTCAGKHAFVESYVEGKIVNATGFSSSLGSIDNLPIVNAIYAYDYPNGDTILLVVDNAIYFGSLMDDSLLNPIQCFENDVKIDLRPSKFYQDNNEMYQSIHIPKLDLILPIEYNGVFPSSLRRF